MAVTVRQAESVVISRAKGFLTRCGMDTTATGTNADLADAIASAVRALDGTTADPSQPSDADLAQIADARLELFLSVAHLFALRTCAGRWAKSDQAISVGSIKFKQVWEEIDGEYKRLAADLLQRYGFGRKRRNAKLAAILQGNTWPSLPPPPSSAPPWPSGYTPAPGPQPASDVTNWGFNP